MDTTTKSGLYYPNRLALATFNALIDVMGKNGLNAILNYAHLREYINQYPPDDLEKGFDFADFTAMQYALVEMYGEKGGQTFLKRAGRSAFSTCMCKQGALAGVSSEAFHSLPLQAKQRIGLQAMVKVFSQISDQTTTVEDVGECFMYRVQQCPECWGQRGKEKAICSYGAGLLEEGLNYISGGSEFKVLEIRCMAKGDEFCEYTIDKTPIIT
jgi:predicted hydrocarbon binding protein